MLFFCKFKDKILEKTKTYQIYFCYIDFVRIFVKNIST
jgi:hypothetical protein